ncbi:MAG: hypothetical protein GY832_16115 [Chloroflexi bacterium]|nr:hypothetical protein [Chloroflexota bacterium]
MGIRKILLSKASLLTLCALSLTAMLGGCLPRGSTESLCKIQLESTGLNANPGIGNIAWSHNGKHLAYIHGYSIWIVSVGDDWSETIKVYTAGPSESNILRSRFIAWSPDDRTIGFTLEHPINAWEAEDVMTQLDWQNGTVTTITDEKAELIDWSNSNWILAWRDGIWIFDISSQVWHPLVNPTIGKTSTGLPHWTFDETVILGIPLDWQWSNGMISEIDWQASQWTTMSIDNQSVQMMCNSEFPCRPVPSPDQLKIAWIEAQMTPDSYTWSIVLYDKSQAQISRIVNSEDWNLSEAQALTWSPDSKQLGFSAREKKSEEHTIWILSLCSSD